jgi:hypothetical protein
MILPSAFTVVTSALQSLVKEAVPEMTEVTALTPPDAASSAHESRVNLFLYRVSPDPTLRSKPGGRSTAVQSPALELRYLVTAYGNPTRAMGQTESDLLWTAFTALHGKALLSIPALGKGKAVKIVPEDLSLDALAALWPATKAEFRPALAFVVHLPALSPIAPPPAASPADVRESRLERLASSGNKANGAAAKR